jgi:hypothetical protein
MPCAREIVFTRGGHLSNLTEARAYNLQVSEFCASVDGDAQKRVVPNRPVRN